MNKNKLNAIAIAVGVSITCAGSAIAADSSKLSNPFDLKPSVSGDLAMGKKDKAEKEHSCGEGKCGDDKSKKEHSCGEGKCGDDKSKKEGSCGEGKCGDDKSKKEGSCGEGKCGDK